jgi:hypothetical protein
MRPYPRNRFVLEALAGLAIPTPPDFDGRGDQEVRAMVRAIAIERHQPIVARYRATGMLLGAYDANGDVL